ncbi:MAG: hypothetical protein EOO59_03345 [Hymenobacter sp.]|nr:MAG: hypothetical protein EOO59_03345 [Hymenobacter sp.]
MLLLAGALLYATWQLLRRRASSWVWAWWVAAGLMVLAFVFLPDAISGGSVIRPRWGIFSYLLLLASLAAVQFRPRARAALLLAGTTGALLLLGFRYVRYGNLQSGLADYLAVSAQLQPHSSVLPLIYANPERMPNGHEYPSVYNMLSHAASYVSVERQLLDFENYEAETNYFPLLWRPGRLPLRQPNGTPARPTPVLLAHPARYVVLWGRRQPNVGGSAANRALINQYLAQHYRFAYRSPAGLLELYSQDTHAKEPLVAH